MGTAWNKTRISRQGLPLHVRNVLANGSRLVKNLHFLRPLILFLVIDYRQVLPWLCCLQSTVFTDEL